MRLPIEFQVLGIKPGRWTPEVVISRHNGLFANVTQEVQYAQLVRILGAERARELFNLHPGRPKLEPDPSLNLSLFSDAILAVYKALRTPVDFLPIDVEPAFRAQPGLDLSRLSPAALITDEAGAAMPSTFVDPAAMGSNNWVIAGSRSFAGGAIMANDPHRQLLLPSLRYWVHLVAPGWNVIGAGEPALPGVSIGHNEHGAWGLTIFPIDQEDLFAYETDPADPSRYRYRDGWEQMRLIRETIVAVKGQRPRSQSSSSSPGTARSCRLTRPITEPLRWALRGVPREARPTWPASDSTRPRAGTSSARHAASSTSLRKTWSGPIATATSAGRP